jgi:heme exporter protein A
LAANANSAALSSTAPSCSSGISFQNIEKRFGSLAALRGISLDVQPGEFVALLGHNGAGKTTLLRIAALLMNPSRGSMRFISSATAGPGRDSRQHAEFKPKHAIGMVGHSTLLYDELTAAENLGLFAKLYGLGDIANRINTSLADCGLESRAGSLVRTFSRGMRQRLAIARALLHQPAILLLDEPAAGLDRQGLGWFSAKLTTLKSAGCTILMSTHARNESLELATRAVSLVAGSVQQDSGPLGDPQPLLAALRAEA